MVEYQPGWRYLPKMMVFGSTETIGNPGWLEGAEGMVDRVLAMDDPLWIRSGIDVMVDVVKPERTPKHRDRLSKVGYASLEEATEVAMAGLAEFRARNGRLDSFIEWPTGVTIRGA
jgi:hypothetical protein